MRGLKSIMRFWVLVLLLAHGASAMAQHYVLLGGLVDSTLVLPKLGADSAYLVSESLTVSDAGTLVVEPGCKLYFAQSTYLRSDGGSLVLEGQPNDSIYLLCYEFSHDWTGIQLKNVREDDTVSLSYVTVMGFLTAMEASSSKGISVRHSTFTNYYAGRGVSLVDCENAVVDSCLFFRCNSGIELKARGNDCKNNLISHCVFDQGQINVEVSSEGYGYVCHNNVISGNCFQNAATAISFESVGGLSDKDVVNYILGNMISSKLPEGSGNYSSYGIKAAMDSLVIRNNVFWRNDEAVRMLRVCHLVFHDNTFYENGLLLTNLLRSGSVDFVRNTVSEANAKMAWFPSHFYKMNNNNFLHYKKDITLFTNGSSETVDMRRNFWDTQSADDIEAVVFHKHDDPELGQILYDPFLPECDTVAPISPPFRVKKQWVDGTWLISWDNNPEANIDHYVLFYGAFDHYKFAHHIDMIHGNSYAFSSQQVDNVAVMACRDTYDPDVYSSPSQSAYAFASYYPYAGADAYLCAPELGFEIQDSNIPYTYNRFVWQTSGTGVFSDSLALRPVYYPSEEDFDAGEVTLSLCVLGEGVVRTDDMHLALYKELEVDAGRDYYSGLNRPIHLVEATAENYDSLRWYTLGDGRFEDACLLNTDYHLGNQDKTNRFVQLVLEAWSFCGYACDTLRFDLFEDFSLEGKTWVKGVAHPNTQVIAVSMDDNNPFVSGFYRTVSDEEGRFRFESLLPDTYLLYAFPDTVDMTAGGAYYLGDLQWNESNRIVVDGNVYDVDMVLPDLQQGFQQGEGSISGVFDYPEVPFKAHDFYCKPWLYDDEGTYCSDGLSNVGVLLLNSTKQRLLGFILTGRDGSFRFGNLPFGTYHVMADLPRYGKGTVERITLSSEQPHVADLHLFVTEEGRVAMRHHGENVSDAGLAVYPNPAEKLMVVSGLQSLEEYSITIADAMGRTALPQRTVRVDLTGECSVSVDGLPSGVYFLQVNGKSICKMIKFVKY